MPAPNLLRPCEVVIMAYSPSQTGFDREAREPVRSAAGTEVRLQAQVKFESRQTRESAQQGHSSQFSGRLVFLVRDLEAKGYTPRVGDRIVRIGNRATNLYVDVTKDSGHWEGGHTLLMAYFSDRNPQTKGPLV